MISKMTSAIAATAKCRSVTDPGTEANATTDGIVLFRRIPLMLRSFIRIGTHLQALAGAGALLAIPCHFATADGVTLVPASMQRYNQVGVVYCRLKKPHALTAPLTLSFPSTMSNGAATRFVEFMQQRFREIGRAHV